MPRTLPAYVTRAILDHHAAALDALARTKTFMASPLNLADVQRLELQIAGERIESATRTLLAYTIAEVAVEPVKAEAA